MPAASWLMNLGFAGGAAAATAGTFTLISAQTYLDGALASKTDLDGAKFAETYMDGAKSAGSRPE